MEVQIDKTIVSEIIGSSTILAKHIRDDLKSEIKLPLFNEYDVPVFDNPIKVVKTLKWLCLQIVNGTIEKLSNFPEEMSEGAIIDFINKYISSANTYNEMPADLINTSGETFTAIETPIDVLKNGLRLMFEDGPIGSNRLNFIDHGRFSKRPTLLYSTTVMDTLIGVLYDNYNELAGLSDNLFGLSTAGIPFNLILEGLRTELDRTPQSFKLHVRALFDRNNIAFSKENIEPLLNAFKLQLNNPLKELVHLNLPYAKDLIDNILQRLYTEIGELWDSEG